MSLLCFNVLHCVKLMFLLDFSVKKYMPLILCNIDKNVWTYPRCIHHTIIYKRQCLYLYSPGMRPYILGSDIENKQKRRGRVKILTRPLLMWEMFCENILFILGYDYQSCISYGTQVLRR